MALRALGILLAFFISWIRDETNFQIVYIRLYLVEVRLASARSPRKGQSRERPEIRTFRSNMTLGPPFYRGIVLIKINARRTSCDVSHADKLLSIRPDSALSAAAVPAGERADYNSHRNSETPPALAGSTKTSSLSLL